MGRGPFSRNKHHSLWADSNSSPGEFYSSVNAFEQFFKTSMCFPSYEDRPLSFSTSPVLKSVPVQDLRRNPEFPADRGSSGIPPQRTWPVLSTSATALIGIRIIVSLFAGGDSATRSANAGSAPGQKSCRIP
ncbi:hypothetical protein BOX30_11360 [Leptospirillum ferriphilum]|nr:hypothetical protein BOX30_11360 [Leptospirillum ferriphilum]